MKKKLTKYLSDIYCHYRINGLRSCFTLIAGAFHLRYIKAIIKATKKDVFKYWIERNEPGASELSRQRVSRFEQEPLISIVVILDYEIKHALADAMAASIKSQTYSKWEFRFFVTNAALKEKCAVFHEDEKFFSGLLNDFFSSVTGEYVLFLAPGDILSPDALYEITKKINADPTADFIYSDEDTLKDGIRTDPVFKPDWSPYTLRSFNYINRFFVVKRSLLEKIDPFKNGFKGIFDIILRSTEAADCISHIPKILYHISADAHDGYRSEIERAALKGHLERTGIKGNVKDGLLKDTFKIDYEFEGRPLVSIIIPNKDHKEDLEKCVVSIQTKTEYKNYEILILENNSEEKETFEYYKTISGSEKVRLITWNKPFNYSSINNLGADSAKGEVLLFLNNDTEVINPDWLDRLIELALRKDIGIVGAKLYFPDTTIQHAGVIMNLFGVAGHPFRCFEKDSLGYMKRLKIINNLSAVTGACLMVRKDVFDRAGGFDENFPVTFNDIDFCLQIRTMGYLVVWTPFAELIHHESKSRGKDDTFEKRERVFKEVKRLKSKWKPYMEKSDPYYSPNLSLKDETFSINII